MSKHLQIGAGEAPVPVTREELLRAMDSWGAAAFHVSDGNVAFVNHLLAHPAHDDDAHQITVGELARGQDRFRSLSGSVAPTLEHPERAASFLNYFLSERGAAWHWRQSTPASAGQNGAVA